VTAVHFVVPAGIDDPARVSGGNVYDRQVRDGLVGRGWAIRVCEVAERRRSTVGDVLAGIATGDLVLIDGLVASSDPAALASHADRLRQVVLAHMPGVDPARESVVLRGVRAVVATSRWTGRTLIERYGVPAGMVWIAPPGVDRADVAPLSAAGDALLCVAAVTRHKGHDLLFAALGELRQMTWRCVCAGPLDREPAFVAEQRGQLAARAIADRVCLPGPLAGGELDRAYARADVLVLASRVEGYGMVVTEALARGLPVIATSVGGVPEALGHAGSGRRPGILVPPGDPRSLRTALSRWLRDERLREELRAAALDRRTALRGWSDTAAQVAAALAAI
jgi:glycosyltransferase involved in cell wall biosynthesis